MAEYIEREALLEQLEERQAFLLNEYGYHDYYTRGFEEAVDKVQDFQAADVAPVRHGRWEVYLGGKELMCSYCKTTFWDEEQVGGSNYCPNCGARMDQEAPHAD